MLVVCCETERGSSLIKLIMSERILVVLLLLVFKDFLVAEGETTNINGDCDDWEGIKCKNSRVTSITLSSTGLGGQLSGDIGSLSELEILDLSWNKDLTGSLPQSLGELKKLSTLILVGCSFNGPIPDNIGSLEELPYLIWNAFILKLEI